MRYIDVCSGISAPTAAWKPFGWQALCYAEIEAAPRAVLAHHYPDVPLVGDFTQIKGTEYGPVDLLVGGTPCQSFSIAGLRGGLADDRGNLALEYLRLADRARPRWLVWENVPGVLSSNGGRDFGAILGGMGELGYGFAYRVLDAQHFGVPQRRRRVFVVGYLGDWRRAAAVLFERHSLSGHPAPRREARQAVAALTANGVGTCGADDNQGQAGHLIAFGGNNCSGPIDVATALSSHGGPHGRQDFASETFVTHSLRGEGFDASEDGTGRGTPLVPVCFSAKDYGADNLEDCSPTLRAGGFRDSHANAGVMPAIAFDMRGREGGSQFEGPHDTANIRAASGGSSRSYACSINENQQGAVWEGDTAQALNKGGGKPGQGYAAIRAGSAVRRLTPRECERLQGFPDDFTLVPYRGRMMADGPRYKMLGNSMAVPVIAWIGERIARVDALQVKAEAA
jgi:DNA (cytosine-5)-methyltransferase 1